MAYENPEYVSVLPLTRKKFGYFQYGVFSADGARLTPWPVLTSFDSRFPRSPKSLKDRPARTLTGRFIYAGAMNALFGHFLTEGGPNILAARAAIKANPNAGVLFHVQAGEERDALLANPLALRILEMMGLDPARITYITAPMTARDVIFPTAAFTAKFTYAAHMACVIDDWMGDVPPAAPQKLFFSRLKWQEREPAVDR